MPELTEIGARLRTAIVRAYEETPYATVTVSRPAIALDAARSHVDVSITVAEGDAHAFGRVSIDDAALESSAGALVAGAPFVYAQVERTRRAMLESCRDAGYPHCTVDASLGLETASAPVDVTVQVERGAHATVDAIEVLDEEAGRLPVPRALEGIVLGAPFVGSSVERARLALAALHPDREVEARADALEDEAHVVVRFLLRVRMAD